jgi:hypothetical protein
MKIAMTDHRHMTYFIGQDRQARGEVSGAHHGFAPGFRATGEAQIP